MTREPFLLIAIALMALMLAFGIDYRFDRVECHLQMPSCEEP